MAKRVWPWVLVAMLVTAVPTLLTPMPPMLDYPNHFVRLWLLEGGISDPFISRVYAVDWRGASTNILLDVIAIAMRGFLTIGALSAALLIAGLLLPGLGVSILSRTIYRRLTYWHVLAILLGWTQVFVLGFVNFQIALGLALLAAAGDEQLVRTNRSIYVICVYRMLSGSLLLVAHAFGLLFYIVLVSGLAIGRRWPANADARIQSLKRILLAILPLAGVVALFWLFAVHPADHRSGSATQIDWQSRWVVGSPAVLFTTLQTYRLIADIPFMVALLLIPAVALARGRLQVHTGLLASCAALAVVALLMPRYMAGTALLQLRLPTMLWFALAAAVLPEPDATDISKRVGLAAALLLVAIRATIFGAVWSERRVDLDAVTQVLTKVPAHARILPLMQSPTRQGFRTLPWGRAVGSHLTMWHLPTLAIIERHAFVPTLFANPGKQVVHVRPPFDQIAVTEGAIATVDKLGVPLSASDRHEFGYVERWPCFDYILVLDADVPNASGAMPSISQIKLAANDGFAKLYRIDHAIRGRRCNIRGL